MVARSKIVWAMVLLFAAFWSGYGIGRGDARTGRTGRRADPVTVNPPGLSPVAVKVRSRDTEPAVPVFISRPADGGRKIERLMAAPATKLPSGDTDIGPGDWYVEWNGAAFTAVAAPR